MTQASPVITGPVVPTCSEGGHISVELVAYGLPTVVHDVGLAVPRTTHHLLLPVTLR